MIVKSKSRGDAVQLANYLLDKRDNEKVQILAIHGTATPNDLKRSLIEMELTVELTNGSKGLHHAQIAPRGFESQSMTPNDWLKCVNIYAKNHELEGQKWAAVLHTKDDGTHLHVAFERYNHETGKLVRDNFNYYKNNHARLEMEKELGHFPTPWRRDDTQELDHKKTLTSIWDYSENGVDFIQLAEDQGYKIAKGLDRRPFRVITPEGTTLDLVKQLDGVYTADVRKVLSGIELQFEAEALEARKQKKHIEFSTNKSEIEVKDDVDQMLEMLMKKQRELEQQMRQNGMDQGISM